MSADIMYIEVDENGQMEMRSRINDRGAVSDSEGLTTFGFWEAEVFKPVLSRTYKTAVGKQRAVAHWIRGGAYSGND